MALPLRKPEPITTPLEHFELLHTPDQHGTAVLWEREGLGKRWHKLAPNDPHAPAILRAQVGTHDGFITVNEFKWWRQVDNLKSLRSLYVDIDRPMSIEDISDALHQAKLPWPSLIVWSGRGVHLYWLHAPMPAQVLPVWQRCQDTIIKALAFAGADPAAKDCARVLRLCGTINAKNGAVVQGRVFDPEPWDWHSLCDEILGPRPAPKAKVLDLSTAKANRGQRLRTGSIYDWWHLVYRDLLAIADKHWFGGIPQGHRDHVAMMPGKRKALDKDTPMGAILEKLEKTKVSIRAKVEHPFRVIKRQFGYVKVKYRGLAKNTANLMTLFALSNLWMARKRLLNMAQG